jgi:uncharacterized repeat protein (TIGR03803 family)
MPLTVLALPVLATPTAAQYQVLYNFSGSAGEAPTDGLLADKTGNLYGTTSAGGTAGTGTVFKFSPDGTETVLYSFTGGNDGGNPHGPLSEDKKGNLYGETFSDGAYGDGVVFKIAPDGAETVLHAFSGDPQDGAFPEGGITIDKKGTLYGVTGGGGANKDGTVYEINRSDKFKLLHSFAGSDGRWPAAGVIMDKSGNIYGTTLWGGSENTGTVYKITPDGSMSVLYTFLNGNDGGEPTASLMLDKSGNLYGTTLIGGSLYNGVVFEVTPSGTENVLYTFTGGADGGTPYSALVKDKHGNLYGTAAYGGADNFGIVFKLAPDGTETVLHSFAGQTDGDTPFAGVITDPALGGNYLYGTTSSAACYLCRDIGTIYKIEK